MDKEKEVNRRVFKFKNRLVKKIEFSRPLIRKFRQLKKKIKDRNPEKDFSCLFFNCDKIFPNYTRWMLHYKTHVSFF